jgi:hypothetical protein
LHIAVSIHLPGGSAIGGSGHQQMPEGGAWRVLWD